MIGRDEETLSLREAMGKPESQFVAVYGRRRVGKTYLVRETFGGRFAFYHTGVANVAIGEQLLNFKDAPGAARQSRNYDIMSEKENKRECGV